MKNFNKNQKLIYLSSLTGLMVGTSYVPFFPWAILFCFIPLWKFVFLEAKTYKQILLAGWLSQFILTLIGFHWIFYNARDFGFMPGWVAVIVTIVFAAVMHLYIPCSLVLTKWLQNKLGTSLKLTLAVHCFLYILFEMFWPSIFPWHLGYAFFWSNIDIFQNADWLGFQGLSFLVLTVNALLFVGFCDFKKIEWKPVSIVAVLLVSLLAIGKLKKNYWSQTDKNLNVTVVQGNIGNFEKLYAEKGLGFQNDIILKYFQLTEAALLQFPNTELLVWPESAFPDELDSHYIGKRYPQMLIQFLKKIKKPLLTGAYSKDPAVGAKRAVDYNGLFLMDENGDQVGATHRKSRLLIFGETLPLVDTFPILAKLNPGGTGFGRGVGPVAVPFKDLHLGPQICYESLFPDFAAGSTLKGSDFLVNVTNDSWFGPTFEPHQHLIMTLARGIENRRPMVRSTNTGITSVSLANGDILERSKINTEGFYNYDIPIKSQSPLTFFTKYQHLYTQVYIIGLFILLLMGFIKRKKIKHE